MYLESTLLPCFGPDGTTVTGYRGPALEVTGRRIAEEKLKASETKSRELVEFSPDPIFIHSRGRLEYVNPAGVAFFGAASPEQLVGTPVLRLVHPDFRTLVSERMSMPYVERRPVPSAEIQCIRLDGTVADVEIVGVPCSFGGKSAAQVILRDITWSKKAEAALARNEAEVSAIYQNAPIVMCLFDEARRIQRVNVAAVEFAGLPENELIGSRTDALVGCLNALEDERGVSATAGPA